MKKSKLLVFILLFSFVINFLPKQALANEDKPPENKNKVVEEKKELVVKKEGTDKEISDNGKSVKRRDVEQTQLNQSKFTMVQMLLFFWIHLKK